MRRVNFLIVTFLVMIISTSIFGAENVTDSKTDSDPKEILDVRKSRQRLFAMYRETLIASLSVDSAMKGLIADKKSEKDQTVEDFQKCLEVEVYIKHNEILRAVAIRYLTKLSKPDTETTEEDLVVLGAVIYKIIFNMKEEDAFVNQALKKSIDQLGETLRQTGELLKITPKK